VALEHYSRYFEVHCGLRRLVVRFSNVYGPGELGRGGQGVIGAWLAAAAVGAKAHLLGSLAVERDYLYAGDAGEAVRLLVEHEATGVYNVGSSVAVSLEQVLECVVHEVGIPLELAVDSGEHATAHVMRTQLDCTRLRTETGWEPRMSLTEGIAAAWEWMSRYVATSSLATVRAKA
jgi:UDP-glucose 4-epimerase